MLRALPHLDEAVTISTDNAIQDHAIRLRQRMVQRLAPPRLAVWPISTSSPTLSWSRDSTTASCQEGAATFTVSLSRSGNPPPIVTPIPLPDIGTSIRRSLHSPDGRSVMIQTRQNVIAYTQTEPLPSWSGRDLQSAWFDDSGRLILRTSAGSQSLPPGPSTDSLPEVPPSTVSESDLTVTIDHDTEIHLWRGKPGDNEVCDPLPHSAPVTTTAIDPSGRYIATLTRTGELRVWEIATALPITPPLPVKPSMNHIVWDAAHYQLATWSETDCVLFNW
jgi:hypothetical protein